MSSGSAPHTITLDCPTCTTYLAKEAAAGRVPELSQLEGLGRAYRIADGFPDAHYGFRARREGNECPRCRRRIVVLVEHPRSERSITWLEHTPSRA